MARGFFLGLAFAGSPHRPAKGSWVQRPLGSQALWGAGQREQVSSCLEHGENFPLGHPRVAWLLGPPVEQQQEAIDCGPAVPTGWTPCPRRPDVASWWSESGKRKPAPQVRADVFAYMCPKGNPRALHTRPSPSSTHQISGC